MKALLRHRLRDAGQRMPWLRRYTGRLGLGRFVAPESTREQIRVDGDVTIELDLSVPFFRYLYFHHDLSSAPEILLLRRLLTPADMVVDVGAHIGYFALVAAKYSGHVHAFEASPTTCAYLLRNLELNPNLAARITSHVVGLSSCSATLPLYRPTAQPDTASLKPLDGPEHIVERVTVDTLDNCLSDATVSFLKIDVEGAECDVLEGARGTIQDHRPLVLCEVFEPNQARFGRTCQEIIDFFDANDYRGFHVLRALSDLGPVHLVPLTLRSLSRTEADNVLFVPADRIDRVLADVRSDLERTIHGT
jgi:FkbM family methyltransferase